MSELPAAALFRLAWRPPWRDAPPSSGGALGRWDEDCLLPDAVAPAGAKPFARVWACWNELWLAFSVEVRGKKQVRPYPEQFWLGDCVELGIDARDVRTAHRLSKFCHHFVILPPSGGKRPRDASAFLADDSPAEPADPGAVEVVSRLTEGGYRVDVVIGAEALSGFDPREHPRLGFTYHVNDLELGAQYWTFGRDFPIWKDPSLWGTLILARDEEEG